VWQILLIVRPTVTHLPTHNIFINITNSAKLW
jgi:hypothetical protein